MQLENETELLAQLRLKLGPAADGGKLLFQLRSARGKMHWAGASPTTKGTEQSIEDRIQFILHITAGYRYHVPWDAKDVPLS